MRVKTEVRDGSEGGDALRPEQFLVQHELGDSPPEGADVEGEQMTSTPRRAIRLGVNILWILGAILITALQMCRSGA